MQDRPNPWRELSAEIADWLGIIAPIVLLGGALILLDLLIRVTA
jgi:hypothetical protein